jgi:hypothetical protein
MIIPLRKWPKKRVELLDHANQHLDWIPVAQAKDAFSRGQIVLLGTARKIHQVRIAGRCIDDGKIYNSSDMRRKPTRMGDSHKNETWCNPKGVYTINRLPASVEPVFTAVPRSCLAPWRSSAA